MTKTKKSGDEINLMRLKEEPKNNAMPTRSESVRLLDVHPGKPETFPYVNGDVTAGMENELPKTHQLA